ncbi:hypothetical protein BT61P2_00031 [Bacteroides phage BT61P2]|nr:hypothetical protein BT61P1_00030 [Bacteroides phage BT61P1]WAX09103.1 hypothetical protein BT61P2_00031 [Bacteroides phage BT61P2]
MKKIFIDFETYSDVNIKDGGMYKYTESSAFEILLIGYAVDDGPFQCVDLTKFDDPKHFFDLIQEPDTLIYAHNATFERLCLRASGYNIPASKFRCTATLSLYAGFPEALGKVSQAMKLTDGKLDTGLNLIKLFCSPQKDGSRIYPEDHPEKWEAFKEYLKYDILSEREIESKLRHIEFPASEVENYVIDQNINDRGCRIDIHLASKAKVIFDEYMRVLNKKIEDKYGITSLKSSKQINEFIFEMTGKRFDSINKDTVDGIIKECANEDVTRVLTARKIAYKTSVAKFGAMLDCVCKDGSVKGLYRFYGANRTGRWAGRMVQMQNLTKSYFDTDAELEAAREDVKNFGLDDLLLMYDNIPSLLSQLLRTAFIARKGYKFKVADFSAIEARVIACLANEQWRIDTFRAGGDIYITSAARTFGLEESSIDKHSPYRQQGKVTELALGYGGWIGAIKTMDKKGAIPEDEIKGIILRWRDASPNIVKLWRELENSAKRAIMAEREVPVVIGGRTICTFYMIPQFHTLAMRLPSGRSLHYPFASIKHKTIRYANGDSKEVEAICYYGVAGTADKGRPAGSWCELDTYGGKLTENLVQAVSRDLLASALKNVLSLRPGDSGIVGHVHDELIDEVLEDGGESLDDVCIAMCILPDWAKPFDIPLNAEGFESYFYKK